MKISTQRLDTARNYMAGCFSRPTADGKLPPLRTMIRESGTSRTAITRILEEYEERGLIQRRARIGTVKNDLAGMRIIDLVACHDEGYSKAGTGFLYDCILGLIKTATEEKYMTRLHSVAQDNSIEKYLTIARQRDSAGFVLLEPNMCEIISTFRKTGKPVVALFSQGRFLNVDQVVNAVSIIRMQMEHLIGLGHSKILYLREEFPFYQGITMMSRRLEYYNIMARNGFPIPAHWRTEYLPGELRSALECAFAREPRPTALIVYDLDVAQTYDFLKEKGYRIGSDVSVMATDGASMLNHLEPSVTTLVSHATHTVKSVWSLLEKQRGGNDEPCTLEVMLTFRQGRSTGRPIHEENKPRGEQER